ncbi:hypothetical protein BVC80_1835g596 [Macleaya cordata]|uniref:Uncharacterized protein n=1 Tax=Macleaya cordata TaxID=56857 RepID=A0A200R667_MACCD|nr:hypothetical protein BVC80_1835g596 [Macleaya cordata]
MSRTYGPDSIEAVYMDEVAPNFRPVFARVVLRSESTITSILNEEEKVTLVIDGGNVSARRYVARRPPPPQPPAAPAAAP